MLKLVAVYESPLFRRQLVEAMSNVMRTRRISTEEIAIRSSTVSQNQLDVAIDRKVCKSVVEECYASND